MVCYKELKKKDIDDFDIRILFSLTNKWFTQDLKIYNIKVIQQKYYCKLNTSVKIVVSDETVVKEFYENLINLKKIC